MPGRPTILITVGQGPIALALGAGGGGLDIFTLDYLFSSFSLPGISSRLVMAPGSIPIGNIAELTVIVPSVKS